MSKGKLTVVDTGNNSAVALRSNPKPFDTFAADIEEMGDLFDKLDKVLKEATTRDFTDPEYRLRPINNALNHVEAFGGFAEMIECCKEFAENYGPDDESDEVRRVEVGRKVAQLVGCFPQANASDPAVYLVTLIDDVAATDAGLIEIEAAFRKIRRKNNKFLPAISEVLSAIEKEEDAWSSRFSAIHAASNGASSN